jgi:hypothetical protein
MIKNVVCIDNLGQTLDLKIGKIYQVEIYDNLYYTLVGERGLRTVYLRTRFRDASDQDLIDSMAVLEETKKKYQDECPCGIKASGCDYHK